MSQLIISNSELFEFFKRRWVFDKLSGLDQPTFVLPYECASHFRKLYPQTFAGIHSIAHWMDELLAPQRQLNWSKLLERKHMDRQFTCHRISKYAVSMLNNKPEQLSVLVSESNNIDVSGGRTDVYIINYDAGWR